MASYTIKVHMDGALRRRIEAVNNPTTMLAIHNTLAEKCDPYVPFLEGPLSQTNIVTSEGVTYIQPYARYQYHGTNFSHTTDYHPLASAEWDKAMLKDHGDEFNQEVKNIIQRRLAETNG